MKLVFLMSCLAGVIGCSAYAEPTRVKPLSTTDRNANAISIAKLVRQLCIDSAPNEDRFTTALRKTGWPVRQTQEADPAAPLELDVWRLPFVTLVRSPQPIAGQFWTCSISVDQSVAPSPQRMTAALNSISDGSRPNPEEVGWQWRPSWRRAVHMTLSTSSLSSKNEMMIFVEVANLPPLQAFLGA